MDFLKKFDKYLWILSNFNIVRYSFNFHFNNTNILGFRNMQIFLYYKIDFWMVSYFDFRVCSCIFPNSWCNNQFIKIYSFDKQIFINIKWLRKIKFILERWTSQIYHNLIEMSYSNLLSINICIHFFINWIKSIDSIFYKLLNHSFYYFFILQWVLKSNY